MNNKEEKESKVILPYLVTFEEANNIVQQNKRFIRKDVEIDGFQVSIFNYISANYSNFIKVSKSNSKLNAFEMRGLSFVHLPNSGEKVRFLMLHKFFTINQTESTMYENLLANQDIKSVHEKIDGSLIRFIKLPNDKIVAKSKMSFTGIHAETANNILQNDKKLYNIVKTSLDNRIALIFEFVSPRNQIVVPYKEEQLILLQARDEESGKYLDISNIDWIKASSIEPVPKSLKDVIQMGKDETNREGWIIVFKSGLFVKIKTQWYIERHGVQFDRSGHIIARRVLEDKIDDLISTMDSKDETYAFAKDIDTKLTSYIIDKFQEILKLSKSFNVDDEKEKKEFCIQNKKHPYFGTIMATRLKGEEVGLKLLKKVLKQKIAKTKETWEIFYKTLHK